MTSFYYDSPSKTLYIYNAGLEVAKIFDVSRIDRQDNSAMHLVFGIRGELSAMIFGTQIDEKIN